MERHYFKEEQQASPITSPGQQHEGRTMLLSLLHIGLAARCRTRPPTMQASGLEAERNKATARRGVMERSFLQPGTALVALEQKRAANPIGFGAKAAAAQVKKKKN